MSIKRNSDDFDDTNYRKRIKQDPFFGSGLPKIDSKDAIDCIKRIKNLCEKCFASDLFKDDELKRNFENLKKKHEKMEKKKIRIALFGCSGIGKSSFINSMISGKIGFPLFTSGEYGSGCTKVVTMCKRSKSNQHSFEKLKKNNESEKFKYDNDAEHRIYQFLKDLNEEYQEIDLLKYNYPNYIAENKIDIEFIDLVGVPDESENFDGFKKNREGLELLNELDLKEIDHCEYENFYRSIDAIFLLKDINNDRGRCTIKDLEYMNRSGLFNGISRYRAPMICLVLKKKIGSKIDENKINELRDSVIRSISNAFNYPIQSEMKLVVKTENDGELDSLQDIPNIQDRKAISVLINRANYFIWEYDENGSSNVISNRTVMEDLKLFKEKSNTFEILYDMAIIEAEFQNKLKSKLRNVNLIKKKKYILGKVNDSFSEYEDKIREITHLLNLCIAKLKDYQKEDVFFISEKLSILHLSFLGDIKDTIGEFIDEIESILDNSNDKSYIFNLNEYKENECEYIKRLIRSRLDYLHEKKPFHRYLMEVYQDNSINEEFEDKIVKEIMEILINIKDKLFSDDEKKIEKHGECDQFLQQFENGCSKLLKEKSNMKNINELNFDDIPNNPRRFFGKVHFQLSKLPSKIDKEEILSEKIDLDEFKRRQLLSYTQPKNLTNDKFKNQLKEAKKKSELKLIYNEPDRQYLENARSLNINLIRINLKKEKLYIEYEDTIEKKLNFLLNKVTLFENEYFMFPSSKNSPEETSKLTEILSKPNETIALNPLFIRINDYKENSVKNIHLSNLSKTVRPENFIIFLFAKSSDDLKDLISYEEEKISDECKQYFINKKLPIVFVDVPTELDDEARIFKLMFLIAEYFNFSKFYLIDDDVDFMEYKPEFQDSKLHSNSSARALAFMSKCLNKGINDQDTPEYLDKKHKENQIKQIDQNTKKDLNRFMSLLYRLEENFEGNEIFGNLKENFEKFKISLSSELIKKIIDYINLLKLVEKVQNQDDKLVIQKTKEHLLGPFSTTLGYVSLVENKKMNQNRLIKIRIPTHQVNKPAETGKGCFLYNLDCCLTGIHPITDKQFFDFSEKNIKPIFKSFKEDYFYISMLNGISGFVVLSFSFKKRSEK